MHHDTTPEENRARLPFVRSLLARSGFAATDPLLSADLREATTFERARRVVASHAFHLWTEATRTPTGPMDDRPLYWARLMLSARLRAWRPDFELGDQQRAELLHLWERTSRGLTGHDFPPGEKWLRVVVTGFDPFRLDEEPECSNPSGVAALAMHGWTFPVGERTAVVRSALFPVRWDDFADGMVEEALSPRHEVADAVITLSRGRPDRFDLEVYNGAWRGGAEDNLGVVRTGPIPLPDGPGPQWSPTSLPVEHIAHTVSGQFAVVVNTEVTEIPAGGDAPVVRPQGPDPESIARAGGGGDYLSNEIAYRNTVLRDRTGSGALSGHVHLPLAQGPNEQALVLEQTRAIVVAALGG